eukprot:6198341-Pleurochrysis_carterae.AAC.2
MWSSYFVGLAGASRHSGFRVFPATQPAGRAEALRLGEVLDEMLDAAGSNSAEALRAWDEVRDVSFE